MSIAGLHLAVERDGTMAFMHDGELQSFPSPIGEWYCVVCVMMMLALAEF